MNTPPKISDAQKALNKLNPRQRKYVELVASGETKKDAALEAGYTQSTALSAKQTIESPLVQEAFAELLRKAIPAQKLVQRISEGLEATRAISMGEAGLEHVTDFKERREYVKMAAEYAQYHVPKTEVGGMLGLVLKVTIPRPHSNGTNGHSTP